MSYFRYYNKLILLNQEIDLSISVQLKDNERMGGIYVYVVEDLLFIVVLCSCVK